jgi:hyaluronoglucosaminidase
MAQLCCIGTWAQFLSAGSSTNPYGIYPVPQKTEINGQTATVTQEVVILADKEIDKYTLNRAAEVLREHNKIPVFAKKVVKGMTTLSLKTLSNSPSKGRGGFKPLSIEGDECGERVSFPDGKYDRHYITIQQQKKGGMAEIEIVGENTDATFYGLASLEQILDIDAQKVACGQILDYADLKDRGVIEGYYGVPYSAEVTKDLFRFMARYKMNMYMYGAKSDPYHSQYWADPYPTSITDEQRQVGYLSQDMLRDITEVAHQCKVNFIWAIHPGSAFTDAKNQTVVTDIIKKFQNMYDLGVRQFGVFVDDVGVPYDAPTLKLNADRVTEIQNLIDKRWNCAGTSPQDTVKPLNFVPQLYALSWASEENCQKFFGSLASTPSKVNIYITGRAVWTVPNTEDLLKAKGYLGREVSWWWNYPCNDNDVTKLFPMDTYSNFADETHINNAARLEANLQGAKTLISNPMQQGEASKIALFSIGDYTWNTAAFNNKASWEAALPAVVGRKYAAALRKLAPYLRYYDEEVENLPAELNSILEACQQLKSMETSGNESERLFYQDIAPWLLKLEAMAQKLLALSKMTPISGHDAKWEAFVKEQNSIEALGTDPRYTFNILTGLGSEIKLSTKSAEPAHKTIMPLIKRLAEGMLGKDYFGKPSTIAKPEDAPVSASVPECEEGFYEDHTEKNLIDGNYNSWTCIKRSQKNDDAYTVQLSNPMPIYDVRLCMGTANKDYMKVGQVQISKDGQRWESIPILGTTETDYTLTHQNNVKFSNEMTYCDFNGKGQTAKFVRLLLTEANTDRWFRIYEIEVNGRHNKQSSQGLAVDNKGRALDTLMDGKGNTSYTPANGEVLWNLSKQKPKTLSIYHSGDTDAKVSISTNGNQWQELGNLTDYVHHINLSPYPKATAVKITWQSKAPRLYEITE